MSEIAQMDLIHGVSHLYARFSEWWEMNFGTWPWQTITNPEWPRDMTVFPPIPWRLQRWRTCWIRAMSAHVWPGKLGTFRQTLVTWFLISTYLFRFALDLAVRCWKLMIMSVKNLSIGSGRKSMWPPVSVASPVTGDLVWLEGVY